MSTKENNPGLLSKVAKFVRNPTTNWTDLDKPEPEPDNGYSKQALKEMIERKRKNDLVRKREFDQLRKLRSRDPSADNPDIAGRPSYFQSSLPSNWDDRKMTIKKIDEIEAQMSNQWWQGKNEGAKPPAAIATALAAAASPGAKETRLPAAPDEDIGYAATKLVPMHDPTVAEHSDFAPTQTNSAFEKQVAAPAAEPDPAPKPFSASARTAGVTARSAAASSPARTPSFAAEMLDGITDPDLEEAAIRFANGDNAGAEDGLLSALEGKDLRGVQAQTWTSALFDLYRATGQQSRFDHLAIESAERFGRSAPAWFSIPDLLGLKNNGSTARTMPSVLDGEPIWVSSKIFLRASLDELQLAIANAAAPWFLDWSALELIEPTAVDLLGAVFAEWAGTSVQLRFRGVESLENALRDCTPSGDRASGTAAWRLRMDALRVMQLQDEFELVALDYCVTYEVSPPAWQDARCQFYHESSANAELVIDGDAGDRGSDPDDEPPDNFQRMTVPMGFEAMPATVVELSGEILGEATDALAQLEQAREGGDRLVISCANLIRVDFSAAGSILNWVALRQAEGCNVQFRDVHYLVAAFFNVIGINEHARVVLRSN